MCTHTYVDSDAVGALSLYGGIRTVFVDVLRMFSVSHCEWSTGEIVIFVRPEE